MAKVSVIIFREMLEISIFISIISAATLGIANSRNYIIFGIVIGSMISILLAFIFAQISLMFDGFGAEIFSIAIIFLTIVMVAYTIVKVVNYNSKLKQWFGNLQNEICIGTTSKWAISLMVAATIIREGIEIILFLGSIIATDRAVYVTDYLIGSIIGSIAALLIGYSIYNGLMVISPKYFFKVSFWLLLFIAAALSSEAAVIMTSSGIIISGSEVLWNSAWFISDESLLGRVLKALIGYTTTPNMAQVVFYISTLLGLYTLHYYCSINDCNQYQEKRKR
ncbi:iron permease FTR1 family protein [Orientia chuto str. Dubai]|uniref:Iron permease FTR1 family protein n=1 Tax=Orientia chuto str. Dubai TaxID=1359168 RepID=A0A0F3MQ52_9RICK|nr:FTR1 family protein [Candidatus Orientia mediorientalis]KJV57557.1 iron permease FTR1 family protein [Orientia chuto str. Dubai]